jgi:serine/threonine-protein phosphatase 4 regulatory subunit 1
MYSVYSMYSCVCSLPAVALTLGRSNWPLLKETYETLANDMQWKVSKRVF